MAKDNNSNENSIISADQLLPNKLTLIPLAGRPIFPGIFTPLMINSADDVKVVEEPEQNLFLESQMKNVAFLLKAANVNDENKIVMTTHSPYVLSYITLAAKSYELMNKGVKCDFSTQKQNERQ